MTVPADRKMTVGIITILLTVFAMALTDAFVKYASSDMTLWQIYVCRSMLALPFLVLLVAEIQVRVAVLNGYTALGIPVTEPVG